MSFPRYPEYKDSDVEWLGQVPRHWDAIKLSHSLKCVPCYGVLVPDFEADGVPMLRITDMENGNADRISLNRISKTLSTQYARTIVEEGDVVLSVVGTIGDAFQVDAALAGVNLSRAVARIQTSEELAASFLCWVFQSIQFRRYVDLVCVGTAQRVLNMGDLSAFQYAKAPITEQTQIAAFLDRETAKIDALVAEQRRLMALLKEKRQAVISHAVTRGLNHDALLKPSNNKWLGDVPEHWIVCCLKHIKAEVKNAFVDGPFGSNLKSEHLVDDGDVYVIESSFATQGRIDTESLKTISKEHFATINRSETRGGDIVIAKIGAQYGRASILPPLDKPAVVSGNSLKLTINHKSCDVKFVNWHLANLKELGVMEDIVNATAQPALSLGEMNKLPMLVPPLNEQEAIVQFLNEKLGEFDTLTTAAQRTIELLVERRTALISAAVTGQFDVRAAVLEELE